MMSEPCFEEITGKPSVCCAHRCVNDAKYYSKWGKEKEEVVVKLCTGHKREVDGIEWSEVANLFGSRQVRGVPPDSVA